MKVLDLPDTQEEIFRGILSAQDDTTLVELAKNSKQELQSFLINEMKKEKTLEKSKQNQTIDNTNILNNLTEEKNQVIDRKLSKIKSVFTPQILDKNQVIANQFKLADSLKDPTEKDKALQSILTTLKDKDRLKSITDQL